MINYLKQRLGEEEGSRVWAETQTRIPSMVLQLPEYKTRFKRKAVRHIAEYVALYLVLKERGHADAFDIIHRYSIDVAGERNNRKFRKFEKMPGFFGFYKAVYWWLLHHNDLCDYEYGEKTRARFNFYVTRCLWLDVCTLFGAPELTVCWCHCDTAGFKDMKKMEFRRTCTLAEDGKPCDYCFVRK